jgi:CheY-like chemotaxis protein/HPt (histidine-containing phosphotransfer) domain-containing protein
MTHDEAESGDAALELLRSGATQGSPYQIAILDLMMPGMDGFQLARAIKADSRIDETHLVLLTSFGQLGSDTMAHAAGAAAYLTKPVRQSQLFDCLIDVVGSPSRAMESNASHILPSERLTDLKEESASMPHILILLAEDSIVNQKIAVRQLQKLGYRADAVANGREVLEALARIPYDLVFMDCQMPEMDGYEATAEIRRREGAKKHTKIVAMTANALAGDRKKCIAAGMDDYISKPVRPEALAAVLERIFVENSSSELEASRGSELPPVDLDRVHESMGEEAASILEAYLEQMSLNVKRLNAAIGAENSKEIDSIAHNCAGVSANCGMVAIVAPLRELERLGREGSLVGAIALGHQVTREFERIKLFLDENLKMGVG